MWEAVMWAAAVARVAAGRAGGARAGGARQAPATPQLTPAYAPKKWRVLRLRVREEPLPLLHRVKSGREGGIGSL